MDIDGIADAALAELREQLRQEKAENGRLRDALDEALNIIDTATTGYSATVDRLAGSLRGD